MKRIASILLAVVMLMCCTVSVAEAGSVKEQYRRYVELASDAYADHPEQFGADMIMGTYTSFMMYMNAEAEEMLVKVCLLSDSDAAKVKEMHGEYAKPNAQITALATSMYITWLDGGLTDGQCAELLVKLVNKVIR